MEKFRIAQYGFIPMVALAYGLLGSGVIAKAGKTIGSPMSVSPDGIAITFFHDYGILLSLIIVCWAVFCAYHATIFSRLNVTERAIVVSGLILSALFFLLGSFMIVGSLIAAFSPSTSV